MEDSEGLFSRLEELNRVGISLSREKDIDRLLETILLAAKQIVHADGGTLYRVDDERRVRFEICHTDSLGIAMGGTTGTAIPFDPIPLYTEAGEPNHSLVVAYSVLHKTTVNIADAYSAAGFDFSGTRNFDRKTGYRSQSFLTVPMKDHDDQIIGVLQLINAKDPVSGDIIAFPADDQRLVESLASQAAVALTNRLLINQLEALFESFIDLINAAIDDKSPYTGRHCARVPAINMMLAEAINRTEAGPLKDFRMSESDIYEFKIAGLLHDCGKVTTPVHIVDKSTKLQTIYDRIDLIDTRFEVLARDAEIALLAARLALQDRNPQDRAQEIAKLEESYRSRVEQLNLDREFLHGANMGVECMPEEDRERVRQIARYEWRGADGKKTNFLSDNEVENLTIEKGTLTADERKIINHHIEVTIQMLESLPWPKHLKNVPEYAGGHHERMDGKGYPRGLTREQMSVQARVIGIADIFEALTAKDRPYKPGKKLSESLKILGALKLDGHIDPDLFDVFVREKVYLKYAEKFLDPDQIDDVDLTQIPGAPACIP